MKKNIFEKSVKPWLEEKTVELLGEEDQVLVNLTREFFAETGSARKFKLKIEPIFLEESDNFVVRVWRFLYFEQLKLKYKRKIKAISSK